jgi:tetratricopeptide (TPR) repeat protein
VMSPFESDDDPELAAASARLQEELCVEMGHYGDVRVVLLHDLGQIGSSRGDFALSGRLTRDASGLRIHARLLDGRSANQVWAEDFRGPLGSKPTFYAETGRRIAARVASEQGVVAQRLWAELRQHPVDELTPYGAILRSYQFFFSRDTTAFGPAREALEKTVRERPECALAWVQLARLYSANYSFEIARDGTTIDDAIAAAQTAVRLDPESQRARVALSGAFLVKGELAAGRSEAEKALELNPDSFVYLEWIGWLLALLGEWDRGIGLIRRAMERNPNYIPVVSHALWADHLRRGEIDAAYQTALLFRDATFFWRALMRACCLGHLGRAAEAKHELAELRQRKPDFVSRGRVLIGRHIKFPDLFERVVQGLAKAGLKLD